MTVSRDEVRRIAALAALRVSDLDVDDIAGDLSAIVELITQLEEAGSDGAEPHRHGPEQAPLREDEVAPSDLAVPPEQFAAEFREGFFVAPRPPGVGSDP